ncbi:MAG: hypothetical protein AAGC85_25300 [Bacteroidota bacterium]
MKGQTTYLLLATLFFCGLQSPVLAQKKQDDDWKQKNKRENRFEGTYTRQVGNPSIELLSFVSGLEPYEFREGQELTARFYCPSDTSYFLKAEELRIFKFYWMESNADLSQAEEGWNEFGPWPVDDWLRRLSLTSDKLGVLVRLGNWKSRLVLPVEVTHSDDPKKNPFYIAQFRLGRSISGGKYRLYKGKEKTTPNMFQAGKVSRKPGGSSFPVVLPKVWFQELSGWFTLEVALKEKGSFDDFSYSFSFYLPSEE